MMSETRWLVDAQWSRSVFDLSVTVSAKKRNLEFEMLCHVIFAFIFGVTWLGRARRHTGSFMTPTLFIQYSLPTS